ncbi:Hexose transporter protein [Tolypocladium capitatum]|uniref:Hexose transporter protein n=1 Tax=Tolypocladium capitatum TaxID=45235 RepID=A0A2K3QHL7_9HYPO|nr:Hexose transporter protein [Tolypocladium capitatum]
MAGVAPAGAPKHLTQHTVVEAPRFEKVTWYKEPHLRRLYFLTTFLLLGSATTGYDGMLQNTSRKSRAFFPEYADANKLGILINMINIGSIVSYAMSSFLADNLGRKPTIMVGCVIMIGGACITTFSTGYGMYLGGRFVIGFGNSLSQICSPMLLTEICHPQHRGRLTTVYNCLWNLGSLVVSVIGLGTVTINNDWSWRSITFIQALPAIAQLVGVWWVPESPRFLIDKDKADEALAVLVKHHGGGDANNATVLFEYHEIKQTIEAERNAKRSTSYLDFFKTKGNRWRLAIVVSLGIISQYSGNALFANYIDIIYEGAGIKEQNKKLALTAGKTIMDLTVSVSSALSVDKFGRRPLFLTAITGMVLSFVAWTITGAIYENSGIPTPPTADSPRGGIKYTDIGSGYAQIAFVWLFSVFYDMGFSGLLVAYTLEILPFHLRAKGMVVMNITLLIAVIIGNQTNKVAWDNLPHHWNFMLFYTLWDFCELVFVYFFYIEVRGTTLEEIARVFDGHDAVLPIDLDQVETETPLVALDGEHALSEKKAA